MYIDNNAITVVLAMDESHGITVMGSPMGVMAPQDNGLASANIAPKGPLGHYLPRLPNMVGKTPSIPGGPSDFQTLGAFETAKTPYNHAYETDFEPLTYIITDASWGGNPKAGDRANMGDVIDACTLSVCKPRQRGRSKTMLADKTNSFPVVMCSDAVFKKEPNGVLASFTAVCGGRAIISGNHLDSDAGSWLVGDRLVWTYTDNKWKLRKAPTLLVSYYHAILYQPLQCGSMPLGTSKAFRSSHAHVFMSTMF